MYDWKQEGKGKGKEKYHSFPLQKEGKWEKKKGETTLLVLEVYLVCAIGPSSLKRAQLVP